MNVWHDHGYDSSLSRCFNRLITLSMSHHIIYRWRQKPDTIISSIVHILISLVIIFDISKVFDPIPVKKEVCYLFSLPINFLNHQS